MTHEWHSHLLPSAVEAIGQTPLVSLSRFMAGTGLTGRLLAKLEYLNPGFSKKDRVGRQMIEDAEAQGLLRPGQTVVELTSGNTGTGLAIVCAVKGYRFVAVMSRGNSVERARMMAALGAEVVLVDQLPESKPGEVSGGDLARVEQEAQRLVRERSAVLAGEAVTRPNHPIQRGGYAIAELGFLNPAQIDGYLQVSGEAATATTRQLARSEGIFAGFSSGANVAAAMQLLAGELRGKTVVVLLNDSGLKYLSTDLWSA